MYIIGKIVFILVLRVMNFDLFVNTNEDVCDCHFVHC